MQIRSVQWLDGRFGSRIPYDSDEGRASLDEVKASIPSANYVHLDVRVSCSEGSNEATPTVDDTTGGLAGLIAAITYAKSIGYKILIRIRLRGVSSMLFVPPDVNTWFANYKNAVSYWADFCQNYRVDHFAIGNELSSTLTRQTALWNDLIAEVRRRYKGTVSYSVNFWYSRNDTGEVCGLNTFLAADWLKNLDYIGFSSYPNVVPKAGYPVYPDTPSVEDLMQGYLSYWSYTDMRGESFVEHYGYLSEEHGKQFIFYIGLGSWHGAAATPWATTPWTAETYVDLIGQASWFEAFFRTFGEQPYTFGCSLDGGWLTTPNRSPNNIEFPIQNKPAEQVVQYYYSSLTPPTPTLLGITTLLTQLGVGLGLVLYGRRPR